MLISNLNLSAYYLYKAFLRNCQFGVTPAIASVIKGMDLKEVVSKLQSMAPVNLAEDWDNVGLLVEPSAPHSVERLFLTNDLTEPVLEEALNLKADVILSYHPPIFSSFKRISFKTWKERILVRCLENRIAIYSPHTSFDAVSNGITDWLISAFDVYDVSPITKTVDSPRFICILKIIVPDFLSNAELDKFLDEVNNLTKTEGLLKQINMKIRSNNEKYVSVRIDCSEDASSKILFLLNSFPELANCTEVLRNERLLLPMCGLGRKAKVREALTVKDAIELVKKHCGLETLRVAVGYKETLDSKIKSVAVCCGSGAGVLRDVKGADLYLTGEMSHHEILDAVSRGIHVILTEHSNSERGFLRLLAPRLKDLLEEKVEVVISEVDKDPVIYL